MEQSATAANSVRLSRLLLCQRLLRNPLWLPPQNFDFVHLSIRKRVGNFVIEAASLLSNFMRNVASSCQVQASMELFSLGRKRVCPLQCSAVWCSARCGDLSVNVLIRMSSTVVPAAGQYISTVCDSCSLDGIYDFEPACVLCIDNLWDNAEL